jgi:type I restriction enzyme M protein
MLYEDKIRRMGNAGRNGGEYYTPRPLIRAIIKVVDPKIGETVYDGAVGSAGFLCEAFDHMSATPGLTTSDAKTLQERTFFGKEKKSLAYVIANPPFGGKEIQQNFPIRTGETAYLFLEHPPRRHLPLDYEHMFV